MAQEERHPEAVAEGDERLADFVLEEDDDGDADVDGRGAEQEFQSREVVARRSPVEQRESADACGHRHGARAAYEPQQRVDQQEDERDVHEVTRLAQAAQVLVVRLLKHPR